jgi:hypothetical protein
MPSIGMPYVAAIRCRLRKKPKRPSRQQWFQMEQSGGFHRCAAVVVKLLLLLLPKKQHVQELALNNRYDARLGTFQIH